MAAFLIERPGQFGPNRREPETNKEVGDASLRSGSPAAVPRADDVAVPRSDGGGLLVRGWPRVRTGVGRRARGRDRDLLPGLQVEGLLALDDRQRRALDVPLHPCQLADA